jgi:hypothetical protein
MELLSVRGFCIHKLLSFVSVIPGDSRTLLTYFFCSYFCLKANNPEKYSLGI